MYISNSERIKCESLTFEISVFESPAETFADCGDFLRARE